MVNELIRTGSMTREEAATSRYRNVITRAIGLYPNVRCDTMYVELLEGDRIVLCSDGMSDLVPPDEITRMLGIPSVETGVDELIAASLRARASRRSVSMAKTEAPAPSEKKSGDLGTVVQVLSPPDGHDARAERLKCTAHAKSESRRAGRSQRSRVV